MIVDNGRDISIIHKMLMYCNRVDETMERFGRNHETFLNDYVFRDTISMQIFQIGELSSHLSDDFRASHTDIPWRIIKDMRNWFAHNYLGMNVEEIWNTASNDIPVLRKFFEKIETQK